VNHASTGAEACRCDGRPRECCVTDDGYGCPIASPKMSVEAFDSDNSLGLFPDQQAAAAAISARVVS
jgi:hypothetical protein